MNYKQYLFTPLLFIACGLAGFSAFQQYRINNERKVEIIEKPIFLPAPHAQPQPEEVSNKKKVSVLLEKASKVIKRFEGCRLSAYHDPKTGKFPITIGYGSTVNLDGKPFKMGDTISQEYALKLLEVQLTKDYIPQISKIPHWSEMNDNQKVALISFGYNLGKNFYGHPKFNTITQKLASKQWKVIPDTLKLYSNPKSSVHDALLARRNAEGRIWGEES